MFTLVTDRDQIEVIMQFSQEKGLKESANYGFVKEIFTQMLCSNLKADRCYGLFFKSVIKEASSQEKIHISEVFQKFAKKDYKICKEMVLDLLEGGLFSNYTIMKNLSRFNHGVLPATYTEELYAIAKFYHQETLCDSLRLELKKRQIDLIEREPALNFECLFKSLPGEVFSLIFSNLKSRDLVVLRKSAKTFESAIKNHIILESKAIFFSVLKKVEENFFISLKLEFLEIQKKIEVLAVLTTEDDRDNFIEKMERITCLEFNLEDLSAYTAYKNYICKLQSYLSSNTLIQEMGLVEYKEKMIHLLEPYFKFFDSLSTCKNIVFFKGLYEIFHLYVTEKNSPKGVYCRGSDKTTLYS